MHTIQQPAVSNELGSLTQNYEVKNKMTTFRVLFIHVNMVAHKFDMDKSLTNRS